MIRQNRVVITGLGVLAANGIEYFSDWVNDDMPYEFRTDKGPLWAMPLSTELEDRFILKATG